MYWTGYFRILLPYILFAHIYIYTYNIYVYIDNPWPKGKSHIGRKEKCQESFCGLCIWLSFSDRSGRNRNEQSGQCSKSTNSWWFKFHPVHYVFKRNRCSPPGTQNWCMMQLDALNMPCLRRSESLYTAKPLIPPHFEIRHFHFGTLLYLITRWVSNHRLVRILFPDHHWTVSKETPRRLQNLRLEDLGVVHRPTARATWGLSGA